jgi:hypothetical protein
MVEPDGPCFAVVPKVIAGLVIKQRPKPVTVRDFTKNTPDMRFCKSGKRQVAGQIDRPGSVPEQVVWFIRL